jgi:tetratricopeptide (TPR) repeat protein
MSDKKIVQNTEGGEAVIAKAKDFWTRNNKPIIIACVVVILLGGGWLAYKNLVKAPKETKAAEAMFKAEEYYRVDSLKLALNGDGQYPGFLSVISKYGGTEAANLAHYYAGVCYIKMDDNANAVKQLKKFSTPGKQVQQRAYKLLGDAYADMGQGKDALEYYKKAAHHFEEDKASSSEALFAAAYLADKVLKDSKQAIELFKELKQKYPNERGYEADIYLAGLGVYNAE